jgi:hypothetical protein
MSELQRFLRSDRLRKLLLLYSVAAVIVALALAVSSGSIVAKWISIGIIAAFTLAISSRETLQFLESIQKGEFVANIHKYDVDGVMRESRWSAFVKNDKYAGLGSVLADFSKLACDVEDAHHYRTIFRVVDQNKIQILAVLSMALSNKRIDSDKHKKYIKLILAEEDFYESNYLTYKAMFQSLRYACYVWQGDLLADGFVKSDAQSTNLGDVLKDNDVNEEIVSELR